MNRTSDKSLLEKFYLYRGIAIRSLNDTLAVEHKRTDDILIAGVLTVLLVDVRSIHMSDKWLEPFLTIGLLQAQHGVPLAWRWHLEGLGRLITLRGGFEALAKSKGLESLLVSLWS